MTKISIAFLASLSLAAFGCHKDKDKDNSAALTARLVELKGKMCACKDKACSDKVSAELAQWGQDEEKAGGEKPASPGERENEKVEAIKEAIASCLVKLEVPTEGSAAGNAGAGAPAAAGATGPSAPSGSTGAPAAGAPAAGATDRAASGGSGSAAAGGGW